MLRTQIKVETILKDKGRIVETIRPDRDVSTALEKLRAENLGALVVSRDGSTVDGILSERDIVRGLARLGAPALTTEKRIRHVPVVVGDQLAGMISIGDVVKNRLEELELETEVLRDHYIAST